MHHPFTAPVAGEEDRIEADPANVRGQHYDLIWNGWELGSGSIRIHQSPVQEAVFRVMGMDEEEQQEKFGFLLEALQMGRRRTAASRWGSTASSPSWRGSPTFAR